MRPAVQKKLDGIAVAIAELPLDEQAALVEALHGQWQLPLATATNRPRYTETVYQLAQVLRTLTTGELLNLNDLIPRSESPPQEETAGSREPRRPRPSGGSAQD